MEAIPSKCGELETIQQQASKLAELLNNISGRLDKKREAMFGPNTGQLKGEEPPVSTPVGQIMSIKYTLKDLIEKSECIQRTVTKIEDL